MPIILATWEAKGLGGLGFQAIPGKKCCETPSQLKKIWVVPVIPVRAGSIK
jgi:hypothetical protein